MSALSGRRPARPDAGSVDDAIVHRTDDRGPLQYAGTIAPIEVVAVSFRHFAASLLLACLLALSTVASAQRIDPRQVESSLLVTGTIEIAADGTVLGYTLDQPGKLQRTVLNLVAGIAPHWKFEPVSDPAPQSLKMSLRFVARRPDDTHVTVTLSSAQFSVPDPDPDTTLQLDKRKMRMPTYPKELAEQQIEAMVYVTVRAHPDGTGDAVVRRVDLMARGSQADMARWRTALAQRALTAAKEWRYRVPTQGADAQRTVWYANVPISFTMEGEIPPYGVWQTYLPGPETPSPWENEADKDTNYDAAPPNSITGASTARRLLTPLMNK